MECAVTTKWNNISLRHANITNIIDNTYGLSMRLWEWYKQNFMLQLLTFIPVIQIQVVSYYYLFQHSHVEINSNYQHS